MHNINFAKEYVSKLKKKEVGEKVYSIVDINLNYLFIMTSIRPTQEKKVTIIKSMNME
jgi:hypothetical protein